MKDEKLVTVKADNSLKKFGGLKGEREGGNKWGLWGQHVSCFVFICWKRVEQAYRSKE